MSIFLGTQKIKSIYLGTDKVSKLCLNNKEIKINGTQSECECLCFTANTAGSVVGLFDKMTPEQRNFQISTDGQTWSDYSVCTQITLNNVGDKVYFKGNNPSGISTNNMAYYYFYMTGSIAASGNIMSLIDDGACSCKTIPCNYCFYRFFSECHSLTTAPSLPATTVAEWCYADMFNGCTSLTIAPALPATTLAKGSYEDMFNGCTSLTTPPALPATTLAGRCYRNMFYGCTSLIVSDSSGTGCDKKWTIPTSGTLVVTSSQSSMFTDCATGLGRLSDDLLVAVGASKTYYTQNTPV